MGQERLSRILMSGLLILFVLVRFFFTIRLRERGIAKSGSNNATDREGSANFILRRMIIVPALSVFMFFYFINPPWIRYFMIPLPPFGIWVGAFLGLCGILLLIWVHICLGREWSAGLILRNDHRLIQTGPYSTIRHPMYTALFTTYFSMGIVSSNYVILVLITTAIASIASRIPQEEAMLTERFGEEYKTYTQNTGKFLPKF
jgi:protein-S-isoprenylcysteine O-methyltransferase Ste14